MTRDDFRTALLTLHRGDRVRVRLRPECFRKSPDFDGVFTGKVIHVEISLFAIAMKGGRLRWFTFYPVESITKMVKAAEVAA